MQTEIERDWVELRKTGDPALRERLILQYAPLVKYVVGRTAIGMPGLLSNEDILSYGTIGLIQAVDRFDPTQGVKFETYAIRRIRGSIIDAIRGLQPASREASRRAREIEQACEVLAVELGRMPTDQEVADHLGLTLAEHQAALLEASTVIVSLDTPVGNSLDGEGGSLVDRLADEDQAEPGAEIERRQLITALAQAIEQLSERDRLVITLYYYEELTLREISEVLGVTPSRVCQLHTAALFKLRGILRATRKSLAAA